MDNNNTPSPILFKFEEEILKKYYKYINSTHNSLCELHKRSISLFQNPVLCFNTKTFHFACSEIAKDVQILVFRRNNLIGKAKNTTDIKDSKISIGKVAGIMIYRLAKYHIIHIHSKECNECKFQCISRLNIKYAILASLEYLNIPYSKIPKELFFEILYSLNNRHCNQETLGLVFDSLNTFIRP